MSEESTSSRYMFHGTSKHEIEYLLNPTRGRPVTWGQPPPVATPRHGTHTPGPASTDTKAYSSETTRTSLMTTGESPSHESPGTRGTNRRHSRTNLQVKRASMALRADLENFRERRCCKRMRCFQRVDESALRKAVRETLVMKQADRRERLAGWLRDGAFVFDGERVCSAFLAEAFGFSRDLQRGIKRDAEGASGME